MATETISFNQLRRDVNAAYVRLKNWRKVAAEFGITSGEAYQIGVYGKEPKEAAIRVKLHMPALIPTPACPDCGIVHTLGDVCPVATPVQVTIYEMTAEELAKVDQPVVYVRRKRRSRSRKRRPRASINVENPASAATTILRSMKPDAVDALVEYLSLSRERSHDNNNRSKR